MGDPRWSIEDAERLHAGVCEGWCRRESFEELALGIRDHRLTVPPRVDAAVSVGLTVRQEHLRNEAGLCRHYGSCFLTKLAILRVGHAVEVERDYLYVHLAGSSITQVLCISFAAAQSSGIDRFGHLRGPRRQPNEGINRLQ